MADNKKSFILYCDLIHTIEKLPDEKAGQLFKHILKYVNDKNPIIENDLILELVFEPIKQQLKRDLDAWELNKYDKSQSGILGNLKRWHNDLYKQVIENQLSIDEAQTIALSRKVSHTDKVQSQPIAKIAVNVTANVNETVNVIKNNIEERKLKFADTLKPFLQTYGKDLLNDFYNYWTESNHSNTKMKFELNKTWSIEGRLRTWAKNDKNFNKDKQTITTQNYPRL
jgi:hypothetical protein